MCLGDQESVCEGVMKLFGSSGLKQHPSFELTHVTKNTTYFNHTHVRRGKRDIC